MYIPSQHIWKILLLPLKDLFFQDLAKKPKKIRLKQLCGLVNFQVFKEAI